MSHWEDRRDEIEPCDDLEDQEEDWDVEDEPDFDADELGIDPEEEGEEESEIERLRRHR